MADKKSVEPDDGRAALPEEERQIQRKSGRQTKIKPEHAEYFRSMRSERLASDLRGSETTIEQIIQKIQQCDAVSHPAGAKSAIESLENEWENYQEIYSDLAKIVVDTTELQAMSTKNRELGRRIYEQREALIRVLQESSSTPLPGDKVSRPTPRDDAKSTMSVKSGASKCSSTSSKARTAARSARIAKLKLEQAIKRSELKQRQIREEAELEKTRVELETKRAENELREHLQQLQDEMECAKYEAKLLEEDEEEDEMRQRKELQLQIEGQYKQQKKTPKEVKEENKPPMKPIVTSTPNRDQDPGGRDGLAEDGPPHSTIPNTRQTQVGGEQFDDPKSYWYQDPRSPNLDQTLAATLVQINQQLMSAMKQNSESTVVMKSMIQRQGIPKPDPPKFSGDPAEFPVFKLRMQDWLEEKGLTEKEKISHLLSFVDGDPKEAITYCEIEENGYAEAMAILESQYGHPAKVVRASIKRITDGPRIERGNKTALTKLRNNLQTVIKALRHNEKYLYEMNASHNIERVIDRLPLHMQVEWAKGVPRIRDETDTGPDLTHVFSLVDKQVKIMNDPQFGHIMSNHQASSSSMKPGKMSTASKPITNYRKPLATMATDLKKERKTCICCKGKHDLKDCEVFSKKSTEERWTLVKERKLCHLCMVSGHMRNQCTSAERCPCKAPLPHHKLLHREYRPQPIAGQSPQPSAQPASEVAERKEIDTRATLSQKQGQIILLHVVPVRVISNAGKSVTTYGLLDNASRGTIICSQLAERLGIDGPKIPVAVTTVLGTQDREYKEVSFKLQAAESSEEDPVLKVEQGLSGKLEIKEKILPHEIVLKQHPHLCDINIPEVDLKKVTLIIGEDVRNAHVVKDVRAPVDDEPSGLYATRTALGWTIAGHTTGSPSFKKETSFNFTDTNKELSRQLERFWKIERVGIEDSTDTLKSVEDRRAEDILRESTKLSDGHYETGLLWKENDPHLPNNRKLAESRLNSLKRKFQRDPDFEDKYRKVIQEYVQRGYARKLTPDEARLTTPKTNYLPHHGVTNPNKPGKVRVVFDAAAKFQETSLNKNLLQGPDLSNNLNGVLMRFRQGRVAVVADVEGMFHQVKVARKDQDALRFLWYSNDIDEPPDEYIMTSHIFGATDSPCCANYCLKKTAEDNRSSFDPVVIETVLRNFYVDDMLKALKNEEIAIKVAKDLISLLSRGGFRLTKFTSNSRAVLDSIPSKERANPTLDLDLDDLPIERALGVQWNVEQDTFGFKVTTCSKPNTMRGVLSYVSSFYDPQGFAAPVILPAKQILQECWKGRQTWDEPLKGRLLEKWERWKNLLPIMTEVKIPRSFFGHPADADLADIQLHHFCDASEIGYGTVSYLRATYPDGTVSCSFVQGKSRNAPVRAPTIPRMELQSAVLATRMDKFIQRELDILISKTIFWTDSTITLYCISNESKRFQTYVANRVNEIRESTKVEQWRHCPGVLNPADDCSRGLDAKQFVESERWLKGPHFLWESEESWPSHQVEDVPDDKLEIKKEKACLTTETNTAVTPALHELLTRYSSWTKLLKSVAWIIKFIKWLKEGRKKPSQVRPQVNDLKEAKQRIVAIVQAKSFPDEVRELSRGMSGSQTRVKSSSSIVKLKPMMSPSERIMRVSGRITEAPVTYDAKHQMILPQHHFVTELIINHYHVRLGHCGPEHLLSKLREEFWIVKARASIKKVLGRCFTCKKQHSERMSQEMADLPKVRVTPYEPPFTYTGIDYFGPLQVKRGRGTAKRYGCIFVCMTTRAIHLELAQSLETDAFIMVLRRFINARGSVKQLRSDNGTNFVGAERELRASIREWNHKIIEEELQQHNCEWIFHPPGASHMSGVWERLIRSVKRSMKAILGERTVDEEVLRTVLSEAQAIANSRPLCHNPDDVKDMEALTPNHLLLQRPAVTLPPGHFEDSDLSSRKKWRQVQILANHYWKRWVHEYLPTLQERQKWLKQRRDLMVNDVVLIAEDNVPRGQWLLGRVTQVFPGGDGRIRSAVIKTKNSELHRPIRKLCLLEAAD